MADEDSSAKPATRKRKIPKDVIAQLLYLEYMYKETRNRRWALEYVAVCGMDELPAPAWATEVIYDAVCARGYGEAKTLDQAFGLKNKPKNARSPEKADQIFAKVTELRNAGRTEHGAFSKISGVNGDRGYGSVDTVERLYKYGLERQKRARISTKEKTLLELLQRVVERVE
jgi:hypothetical protein